MSISALNSVSFKGNNTQPVRTERKTGGLAPAAGSFFIAGLGQFMNGNNKSGAKFLAGTVGLSALQIGLTAAAMNIKKSSAAAIGLTGALIASSVAQLALKIADVVKAYKGEQPKAIETEEPETTKAE